MADNAIAETQKTCSVCAVAFPATLEFFNPSKNGKFGLIGKCRPCQRLAVTASKKAHPETVLRAYEKGKVGQFARARQKVLDDPNGIEKRRAYAAKRRSEQRDRITAYAAQWRLDNLERSRRYKRSSENGRRARKREAGGEFTANDIDRMEVAQKGKCWWCQCKLGKHHVDHRIPLAKGGRNDASNLVLACPPCNLRKAVKLPWEMDSPRLI